MSAEPIRHAAGLTWVAPTPAYMRRAFHAVALDGGVWLVDPVDLPGVEAAARTLGEPRAVVQLLDRHDRDCAALAERLGVPHLELPGAMPGSPFEVVPVVTRRFWHEAALWAPAQRVLVVAEAVGTAPYYRAPRERAGVHPLLRLVPPRRLRGLRPDLLLVGHGPPVDHDAAAVLDEAVSTARRRAARWAVSLPGLRRRETRETRFAG